MFFDSSYGIFIKEADKPKKRRRLGDPDLDTKTPETPETPETDPKKKPSDPENPEKGDSKKDNKKKDPKDLSGAGSAAAGIFSNMGESLKQSQDPITRLLGNILDLSQDINIPTDRLAAELTERDRLIRQMLGLLNDEKEVANYFVKYRKTSIPWPVTAEIFQQCVTATASGINFRDALDFGLEHYNFHRDPKGTVEIIKDAAAIQGNNRSIDVMRVLKNAFRNNFSGLNFMMFTPKQINDVATMNRLITLALGKPGEDLYILSRQTLMDKDKATLAREIDDRIKAVFSTLLSGDYYRELKRSVNFVTEQFQFAANTPEYRSFRKIFLELKLATEFRKQLFSSEEATQTSKDERGTQFRLNSTEQNFRLAQQTNILTPNEISNITNILNKQLQVLQASYKSLLDYKTQNIKRLNQQDLDIFNEYLTAFQSSTNNILNLSKNLSILSKDDVNKTYYDVFNPIKKVDAKYKTLIKARLDKKAIQNNE
jgi:hypothetical protein